MRPAEIAIGLGQMKAAAGTGMLREAGFRRHQADARPMILLVALHSRFGPSPIRRSRRLGLQIARIHQRHHRGARSSIPLCYRVSGAS